MKKLLLIFGAITIACSASAQATIVFNNRVAGTLITHVYLSGGYWHLAGNGPSDTPAGSFDWTGFELVSGSGYSAALLAAPGAGAPESALEFQPGSVTSFRTGTAAGQWAGTTVTLSNVAKDAAAATFQVVAWDNHGGTIQTWPQVMSGGGARHWGKSPVFTVTAIGGDFNIPPFLTGLQSFNLIYVPEPSCLSLACLGIAVGVFCRRQR